MAAITVEKIVVGGTEPTLVAAVGPDTFINNGDKTTLIVDNASGGAITVTFDGTGTGPTSAVAFDDDVATSVGAGERWHFGPFPIIRFGPTVTVNYSGVTSLTVAAISL